MKLLSPQDARQIMDVIDEVESLVQKGIPLHQAFEKAVKDASLNRDKAHLVARTWNVSQFLANKDVKEEIGWEQELPLIDFEKVGKDIPEESKEKEEKVASIYFIPPKAPSESINLAHPEFLKYAGVSAILDYHHQKKAKKKQLQIEIAAWEKIAANVDNQLRIKKEQIRSLIQEQILPRIKYAEFDLRLAFQHLKVKHPKAAALLDYLSQRTEIIKKANLKTHYDEKHPFYSNLIKAADLFDQVRVLEEIHKYAVKAHRELFERYRKNFGLPVSPVDSVQFRFKADDIALGKNGSYYKKPVLDREVISSGFTCPTLSLSKDANKKKVKEADSRLRPKIKKKRMPVFGYTEVREALEASFSPKIEEFDSFLKDFHQNLSTKAELEREDLEELHDTLTAFRFILSRGKKYRGKDSVLDKWVKDLFKAIDQLRDLSLKDKLEDKDKEYVQKEILEKLLEVDRGGWKEKFIRNIRLLASRPEFREKLTEIVAERKSKAQKELIEQTLKSIEERKGDIEWFLRKFEEEFSKSKLVQEGKIPYSQQMAEIAEKSRQYVEKAIEDKAQEFEPLFAAKRRLENLVNFVTTDPMLSQVDPVALYDAYRQLYVTAPALMDQPQIAINLLRKYIAQGQMIDMADLIALIRATQQHRAPSTPAPVTVAPTIALPPIKTSHVKKAIPRDLASALGYGLVSSLIPLIFIRDPNKLPMTMLTFGAGGGLLGYFLGNIFR